MNRSSAMILGIALVFVSHAMLAQTKGPAFSACPADPTPFRAERGSPEAAKRAKFSEDEQRALEFIAAISFLEDVSCANGMGRPCSLDELIKSVRKTKGQKGEVIGLARDPRADSNYQYAVKISTGELEISATPQRSGLGGFLIDFFGIHFNPKGPATLADIEPSFSLEVKGILCDPQPKRAPK